MEAKLINRGKEGELKLVGKLNNLTAPDVDEIFDQITGRFDRIILNAEDLVYISSAGLRVIKRAHLTMKDKGGSLIIRNLSDSIKELLEMTGMMGVLNVE